jgi:hypothetical protein
MTAHDYHHPEWIAASLLFHGHATDQSKIRRKSSTYICHLMMAEVYIKEPHQGMI